MARLFFIQAIGIRPTLIGWIIFKTGVSVDKFGGAIESLLGTTMKATLMLVLMRPKLENFIA